MLQRRQRPFFGLLWLIQATAFASQLHKESEIHEELRKLFTLRSESPVDADRLRILATTGTPACDDILETWNASQVADQLQSFIASTGSSTLQAILLPLIKYGVQVRKICASCSENNSTLFASSNFCSTLDYSSNVTFSGLAFIPLQSDSSILSGLRVASVYGRGTRASSEPSTEWQGADSTPELLFNLIVTVVTGCVSVLPDYMGYGESLGIAYRSYIINQSYQTSAVPLVFRMQQLLQSETRNETRLSNGAVVMGYSEGGYAAVSIANALYSIGMDILNVEAGGAPIAISSVQLLRTMDRIDQGTFPEENFFYLALFGSAYSSTNPDLPNYDDNQDMLSSAYRNQTVHLVNGGDTSDTLNNYIYSLDGSDPTILFNSELTNFTRRANSVGDKDPCGNQSSLAGKPEALCAALKEQDLTETVLATTFPINFCQSPDDVLVDSGNVPNVSLNDKLSLYVASGSHLEAGGQCLTQALLWFMNPDLETYLAENKEFLANSNDPSKPSGSSPSPSGTPSDTLKDGPSSSSSIAQPRSFFGFGIAFFCILLHFIA